MDAIWIAKSQARARFATLQASYSLAIRDLEREHVPLCRAHGLGILAYSPLAGGFLSGKYRRGQGAPGGSRFEQHKARFANYDNDRGWRIVDALAKVAKATGATPSQVALSWVLGRECVASVIFGARNEAQLDDNLKAAELKLDSAHRAELDEASAIGLGYPYQFMSELQGRW
jgi:aryl-alcohol dehydrogenase-like predicted oxidoreductase